MRDRYELYVLARKLGQVIERKRSKDQATDGYEVRVLTSYKQYSITDCRVINCMHGGSPTANVMSNNASV